ncbi:hypothetical protein L9F63_021470 [Diploptera punctata]|uniref:Mini-chromosome maintenance complex-binding protein n=1 Tax=Diploptera punctata TaxID=6984 RepID=A0AAD8EBG4_DIPPU|nr:hypothetical protein L9F63_021470 [Diploptera punctata]
MKTVMQARGLSIEDAQDLCGNSASLSYWQEHEAECRRNLNDPNIWKNVRCLYNTSIIAGAEPQLVRFTGMIQDMYDTEMYMEQYELRDSVTSQTRIENGKYRDVSTCNENEDIVEDSVHMKSGERQGFCCISIPAVNNWARQMLHKQESVHAENKQRESDTSGEPSAKRFCPTFHPAQQSATQDIQVRLPLADTQATVCYVMVYDSDLTLSMNEMIEVVGFVSMRKNDEDNMDTDDFTNFLDGPSSAIPRLHAVAINKLRHCNPLLQEVKDEIMADANKIRQELQFVLSQALLGDRLAADYLICHLISTVYQRSDMLTLGQLCLNFFKVPVIDDYSKKLYSLLEKILTKSHYEALTLDNLNKSRFTPKKNYDKNILLSGKLQLSANTHLVLDETCMDSGKLDDTGVRNVAALQVLIMQQKVDYDFNFYPVEIHANVPVLILSEGRSFLSVIQDDFVNLRIQNGSKTSASDLHLMLVLARLISLSKGETVLSQESWRFASNMEEQRKKRMEIQHSS